MSAGQPEHSPLLHSWPVFPGRACLLVLALSAVGTVLVSLAAGLRVTTSGCLLSVLAIAAFLVAGWLVDHRRGMGIFASALYAGAFLCAFFIIIGVYSYAAAALNFPLIDARLAAADQAIGFDWRAYFAWLERYPLFNVVLAALYQSSTLMVSLCVLILAYSGRLDRLVEFCLVVSGSALIIVSFSAIMPAAGAFAYYGIEHKNFAFLSAVAGDYHLKTFEALRSGALRVIDPLRVGGVVTFPSFHTALAMATAWALRSAPYARWPMFTANALVVLSTLSEGGHYLVDVFAGAAIVIGMMFVAVGPASESRRLPDLITSFRAARLASQA